MSQANRHQHIVPVQMIRRFTGSDGLLVELFKPDLRLGTRRKSPKRILFSNDYYKDRKGDFDDALRPIENTFAQHIDYLASVNETAVWPVETFAAFVNWVAALLCRTDLVSQSLPMLFGQEYPELESAIPACADICRNLSRAGKFTWYQDLFLRTEWRWRPKDALNGEIFVITDNPACRLIWSPLSDLPVFIVPLTRTLVFFGGTDEDVQEVIGLPTSYLNFCLGGWANRSIYCAERETLAQLVHNLRGQGDVQTSQELLNAARKPFFGIIEWIAANPLPTDLVRQERENPMADRFGRSIVGIENEESGSVI